MAVATTCPECSALIPAGESYCHQCGVTLNLDESENLETPDLPIAQKDATSRQEPPLEENQPAPTSDEPKVEREDAEKSSKITRFQSKERREAPAVAVETKVAPPKQGPPPLPIHAREERLQEEPAAERKGASKALLNREYKLQGRDYAMVLKKIRLLMDAGHQLYGLFGRPSTGKSCLIYALRQHFKQGSSEFGGFTPEGESWDHLAQDLEKQWRTNRPSGTARDEIHIYQATNPRKKNHFALLDVAGEHFEDIKSWSSEIFDFFGTYLANCKGFFILVELDDSTVGHADYGKEGKSQQLKNIVSFLSVAATIGPIKNSDDLDRNRELLEQSRQRVGKRKVNVPVVLCLSKADRISAMDFGPAIGRIHPGKTGDPLGDPWNVVKTFWPAHFQSLLSLVPRLKIEWLSCLGPEFETTRRFSGSMGLHSAFEHVILDPPPPWSMSSKTYLKLRKWLRIPN